MQALPDDIRQQIEGAMAAKRSDRQTRSSTRSQTLKSGDPPPRQASNIAHSSSSGAASTYGGGEERPDTSRKKDEAIVALPSPSQVSTFDTLVTFNNKPLKRRQKLNIKTIGCVRN